MTQPAHNQQQDEAGQAKAEHGARSDVNWDDGRGSEPYANQDAQEGDPSTGDEFSEGDRGELSGRNLEQLDAVKKMP